MTGRAFVLVSGGVDSTTCLYLACEQFTHVEAVSIFYGQRHYKEIEYARKSAKRLARKHHTIDLSGVIPKTMLTDPSAVVPNISYAEISGVSPTYVPYRNGLLLSAVTSYVAGQRGEEREEWAIYFGAHMEDAHNWAYPDCTPEWIGAMANAIYIGTYHGVRLHTPLEWLRKHEIIMLGETLGVHWEDTWSCYRGGANHCGTCPTCRARQDGFNRAGVLDPTDYAELVT